MKTINSRTTKYEIDNIFLERHSPRAMSGKSITKDELMTLFEGSLDDLNHLVGRGKFPI